MHRRRGTGAICRLGALAVLFALSGSGCATTAMKGTPFFSGEFHKRQGPAEDRINLWPLVYHREPATSVLWPIGEHVDGEHLAIRPFFSVYHLDRPDGHEWNVLWPIFQQDGAAGEGRVFPLVWWGEEYFNVVPLYWHGSGGGALHDTLLPVWWYDRHAHHHRFITALGLAGRVRDQDRLSWWAFPLAGDLNYRNGSRYAFQLWPLAHQYEDPQRDTQANALLPLWYWRRSTNAWGLVTPLWQQGVAADGTDWRALFPLFWSSAHDGESSFYTLLGGYRRETGKRSWLIPLLLSGGARSTGERSTWLLGGLGHWRDGQAGRHGHLLPFYARSNDERGSRFYSMPWSRARRPNGSGWALAPPFYYHRQDPARSLTLSPLYLAGQDVAAGSAWRAVVPLYYVSSNRSGRAFATLLGGKETDTDGHSWLIYPLLSKGGRHGGTNDWWVLAPFSHFHWDGRSSRSHVLPFYYRDTAAASFYSLAYSAWTTEEGRRQCIPPLLSWHTRRTKGDDWWLAAGLGHFSSGPDAGSSHLLPVYYNNPRSGTALSPVYARWTSGGETTHFIPPLLSGRTRSKDSDDWWALLGLFDRTRYADGTTRSHLLPLYARDQDDYFYTPLFGKSRSGYAYYATPLIGSSRKDGRSSHWVFPLYARSRDAATKESTTRCLWSVRRTRPGYSHVSFLPFFNYTFTGPLDRPLASNSYEQVGSEFWCLPWCWRDNVRAGFFEYDGTQRTFRTASTRTHGAFPLWSSTTREDDRGRRFDRFSFLWLLYDRYHEVLPLDTAPGGRNDYLRRRVLWHLWHYEKLNGDVSVDLLPGMTYDARRDGFRQYSFLWRVFRWQRDADGHRKLDLLFLPLVRK